MARGLSQRALALKVGLPQSHISKIESGGVDIRLGSLIELARVLELELELVPRKAVPAVKSIIRQTAPSIDRDRQARMRDALAKAGELANRWVDLDRSQALHQFRDVAHALEHRQISAQDQITVHKALEAVHPLGSLGLDTNKADDVTAVLESPEVEKRLKSAVRTLKTVRNRAVPLPAADQAQPRPAYDLSDEDEDG